MKLLKLIKKRKHERVKKERLLEQRRILKDIFLDDTTVRNGPFKGMSYIPDSHGSMLLPKITGSYEEPIQHWVEDVIHNKEYKDLIDIGCAEGYYACGFALKMPNTNIWAFDISEEAQKLTQELAQKNALTNVTVGGICSSDRLNKLCQEGTLVFCDIEGGEKDLLLPEYIPNLKKVDLIIESHDCIVPNITEELISRFKDSHNITMIIDYPNRVKPYQFPVSPNDSELKLIFDERRSKYMRFLYLTAK